MSWSKLRAAVHKNIRISVALRLLVSGVYRFLYFPTPCPFHLPCPVWLNRVSGSILAERARNSTSFYIMVEKNWEIWKLKVRNTVARLARADQTLQSKPQKPDGRFPIFSTGGCIKLV